MAERPEEVSGPGGGAEKRDAGVGRTAGSKTGAPAAGRRGTSDNPAAERPKGAPKGKAKAGGDRARLSSYAAEAAKLLSGSGKDGTKSATGAASDPVAEDEQGKESRPLRKGRTKPPTND